MMRVEIPGLTSVQNNVGLGDGPAPCFPLVSKFVVFKILFLRHARSGDVLVDFSNRLLCIYNTGCDG
jgi:hypothetical protein